MHVPSIVSLLPLFRLISKLIKLCLMKTTFVFLSLLLSIQSYAQLQDGSTAPNFTLTDIVDSNSYTLYDYLDAGKTVFIEIFAAHCPSCWGYHEANTLKDLYNNYGPNGSDEVMVLALEYDEYNFYEAFVGIGPAWVTAGNWLDGTPYPIFQVEGGDRTVFSDYNVTFYPVVYMVCPNKSLKRVSTSLNVLQLYGELNECAFLSENEEVLSGKIYVNAKKQLIIERFEDVLSVKVASLRGEILDEIAPVASNAISLATIKPGMYLLIIESQTDSKTVRIHIPEE